LFYLGDCPKHGWGSFADNIRYKSVSYYLLDRDLSSSKSSLPRFFCVTTQNFEEVYKVDRGGSISKLFRQERVN